LLRRLRPADPPYMVPTAYVGRSKLTTLCGELLGDVIGKTVLDFGCGDGLEALELGQLGAERVIGVDANFGCVEIARIQRACCRRSTTPSHPEARSSRAS